VQRIHDSDTFCRLVIRSADAGVLVDMAVPAPPDLPASSTPAGPTLAAGTSHVVPGWGLCVD
jgi:hypothetical protein